MPTEELKDLPDEELAARVRALKWGEREGKLLRTRAALETAIATGFHGVSAEALIKDYLTAEREASVPGLASGKPGKEDAALVAEVRAAHARSPFHARQAIFDARAAATLRQNAERARGEAETAAATPRGAAIRGGGGPPLPPPPHPGGHR